MKRDPLQNIERHYERVDFYAIRVIEIEAYLLPNSGTAIRRSVKFRRNCMVKGKRLKVFGRRWQRGLSIRIDVEEETVCSSLVYNRHLVSSCSRLVSASFSPLRGLSLVAT